MSAILGRQSTSTHALPAWKRDRCVGVAIYNSMGIRRGEICPDIHQETKNRPAGTWRFRSLNGTGKELRPYSRMEQWGSNMTNKASDKKSPEEEFSPNH